ncbi:MAG: hypothetical protein IJ433_00945 [Ruminococcus sp.]|nr:hypothetical protein [Ruminococcus sp.]
MKFNARILTVILTLILIISCCVIPAQAALAPLDYGDVDGGGISIMDATAIQQYLVNQYEINPHRYEAADVDSDGDISIIDATFIQMYLASVIDTFPAGDMYSIDKWLYDVCSDYSSGRAIAGEIVTFTADGYAYPDPYTFSLYVNGELVDENSQSNTLCYTFEKAGTYSILVTVRDKWGTPSTAGWTHWRDDEFVVVDKPQDLTKPYIAGIYRESVFMFENEVFTNVMYGTAPYQYKYTLKHWDTVKLETEYSDNSVFTFDADEIFDRLYGSPVHGLVLTVDVKDANGNTDSFSYDCSIHERPIG